MFKFVLSLNTADIVIIEGLVVPRGSLVSRGVPEFACPSADSAAAALKLLFGIKKRPKRLAVEEDEPATPPKRKISEDSVHSSEDEASISSDSEVDEDDED